MKRLLLVLVLISLLVIGCDSGGDTPTPTVTPTIMPPSTVLPTETLTSPSDTPSPSPSADSSPVPTLTGLPSPVPTPTEVNEPPPADTTEDDPISSLILSTGKEATIDANGNLYFSFRTASAGVYKVQLWASSDTDIYLYSDPGFSFVIANKTTELSMEEHLFQSLDASTDYYIRLEEKSGHVTPLNISVGKVDCAMNEAPVFTHHLVDPEALTVIVPPGLVTSGEIKPHSYVKLRRDDPGKGAIYAPASMELFGGTYYWHDETTDIYSLSFRVSCEVELWIDHVVDPVDKIKVALPSTPADTSQSVYVPDPIFFEVGEFIGYAQAHPWTLQFDFGLTNETRPNSLADPDRLGFKYLYSDCPYDYFEDTLRPVYYRKFGENSGELVSGAECRSADQDVPGTISGAWFSETEVECPYGDQLFIGRNVAGTEFDVGGLCSGRNITVSSPDGLPLRPHEITSEYGYSTDSFTLYFRLNSNTSLSVYYDESGSQGPASFPAFGYHDYVR
ncbi:hypothetical protein ACFLU3_00940 [Chloroflexota bacterium]